MDVAFCDMAFYDVLQDMLRALRLSTTDLEAKTEVTTSNIDWWKNRPDSRPQRRVLERIEEGLGIEFEYGEGVRNVVGWRRKPGAYGYDESQASNLVSEPAPPLRVGVRKDENGDRHTELKVPGSAREFYESFEFHGGKVDWDELDEESRSFYENLHSFLLHSIDSLNERFAAGLRELRAARERELRAALEEFEKTFRKRMLGILGN